MQYVMKSRLIDLCVHFTFSFPPIVEKSNCQVNEKDCHLLPIFGVRWQAIDYCFVSGSKLLDSKNKSSAINFAAVVCQLCNVRSGTEIWNQSSAARDTSSRKS